MTGKFQEKAPSAKKNRADETCDSSAVRATGGVRRMPPESELVFKMVGGTTPMPVKEPLGVEREPLGAEVDPLVVERQLGVERGRSSAGKEVLVTRPVPSAPVSEEEEEAGDQSGLAGGLPAVGLKSGTSPLLPLLLKPDNGSNEIVRGSENGEGEDTDHPRSLSLTEEDYFLCDDNEAAWRPSRRAVTLGARQAGAGRSLERNNTASLGTSLNRPTVKEPGSSRGPPSR